jgi:hypothetical protein
MDDDNDDDDNNNNNDIKYTTKRNTRNNITSIYSTINTVEDLLSVTGLSGKLY